MPTDPQTPRTLGLAIYGLVVGTLGTGAWWLLTGMLSYLPPWWSLAIRVVVVLSGWVLASWVADPFLARLRSEWCQLRRLVGGGGTDAA